MATKHMKSSVIWWTLLVQSCPI